MEVCRRCNGTGHEPDQLKLGAQMRAKRMESGLSLKEVARRLNRSVSYLSDLERGKRAWSPEYLKVFESLQFIAFVNDGRPKTRKKRWQGKGKK